MICFLIRYYVIILKSINVNLHILIGKCSLHIIKINNEVERRRCNMILYKIHTHACIHTYALILCVCLRGHTSTAVLQRAGKHRQHLL